MTNFAFEGEPRRGMFACFHCASDHPKSAGFVTRNGNVYAGYIAIDDGERDAVRIELTIGGFEDPEVKPVSFGCEILPDGQDLRARNYVQPGRLLGEHGAGRLVTEEDAQRHPLMDSFWELVDWIEANDPLVSEVLAG